MTLLDRALQCATSVFILLACDQHVAAEGPNKLTENENPAGFKLLFNGKDLEGWKPIATEGDDWPPKRGSWTIEDESLVTGGDALNLACSQRIPADFELLFEWRDASKALPGHTIHTWRDELKPVFHADVRFSTGALTLEFHLEDIDAANGEAEVSTFDFPAPIDRRPEGDWNESRILCKGGHFQFWINGKLISADDLGSDEHSLRADFPRLPQQLLSAKRNGFRLELSTGDQAAHCRNIRVRSIPPEENLQPAKPDPWILEETLPTKELSR